MKRRNRKLRKALLMVCCALTLVAISVGATLAYLTDSEGVTNTFTVGHVDIQLKETDVDKDGSTQKNAYHLLPGQTYTKDPTITVEKGSEDAFVVAKIDVTGMKAANNRLLYSEGGVNGFIGFGDQRACRRTHEQLRHQIFKHGSAPGKQCIVPAARRSSSLSSWKRTLIR